MPLKIIAPMHLFILALMLTSCAPKLDKMATGSLRAPAPLSQDEQLSETARLASLYAKSPNTIQIAYDYGRALRLNGQTQQAVAVLQKAAVLDPQNKVLLGEYGRALADNKQNEQAIDVLSRAHTPEQPDWRILNILGTIYDTQGRFEEAQRHYTQALKIQPNDSGVLTNLGLSHALAGKLPQGEMLLRQAFALNATDNRIRTNLALVIALQGRRDEAENLARSNLPPQEGEANVSNLRALLPTHLSSPAQTRNKPLPTPIKYQ